MTKQEFENRFNSILRDFSANQAIPAIDKIDLSGKDLKQQLGELFSSQYALNQQFVKAVLESFLVDEK